MLVAEVEKGMERVCFCVSECVSGNGEARMVRLQDSLISSVKHAEASTMLNQDARSPFFFFSFSFSRDICSRKKGLTILDDLSA